jgi:4-alpha-glucanotransferase
MEFTRSAGILLHLTSLPSRHGIGDLGPEAFRFADFLIEARQCYWQILPLTPVEDGLGNSPYSSLSAFAGNILLISLERLAQEGMLETSDVEVHPSFQPHFTDYKAVREFKLPLLEKAYHNFVKIQDRTLKATFADFCQAEASWLDSFALFKVLKDFLAQKAWNQWPETFRNRQPEALAQFAQEQALPIEKEKSYQFLFRRQWNALRSYCQEHGLQLFGDLPIYVNYDSVDVWMQPQLFKLDESLNPRFVAGTPPDYFSKHGQLWGNPVYDWDRLQAQGFDWWLERLRHNFKLFDLVRLDHFLGFVNYYEIPADAPNATYGKWVMGPADAFMQVLLQHFPQLPIVAEDLGTISQAVRDLMARYQLPGMKVLQFAFGGDNKNPYLPHNHQEKSVVYTATHDNNTSRGWWRTEADELTKANFGKLVGKWIDEHNVADEMCWMALSSKALVCILPMQDVLGLDESARMNIPGIAAGNWAWRLEGHYFNDQVKGKLHYYTTTSGRG